LYTSPTEERIILEKTQRRAAAEALGPWIAQLRPWSHFLSLTYDPTKRPLEISASPDERRPPPADRVNYDVRAWLKEGRLWMSGQFVAIAAVERHQSGWPHVHAVLDLRSVENQHSHAWCQEWYKAHGYAVIEPCRDLGAASRYCAKYLVKEEHSLTFWPLRGALVGTTTIRPR
jgi:hypothetical protein